MGWLSKLIPQSTKVNVALRYLGVIVGAGLTVLGLLGYLDQGQIAEIKRQIPAFTEAVGALMTVVITVWAVIHKNSARALETADQIDKKIPPSVPIEVVTPGSQPNIVVPPATEPDRR